MYPIGTSDYYRRSVYSQADVMTAGFRNKDLDLGKPESVKPGPRRAETLDQLFN
jgi:hypothetical protein